ncbi:MAG: alpha-L-rhamnosidase C-terminal domain-containing protein [Verrucomicrobiota bacterium]
MIDASLLARLQRERGAVLLITAETYYQAWVNGICLGHGPAKSPDGERFIDSYDLSAPGLLRSGENILEILVHAAGTGTMNSIHAPAGLLFAVTLPDGRVIPSDAETRVCTDRQRGHRTVRRWIFPCIEDIDADSAEGPWTPACIIKKTARLLPRPVALPSRRPISPGRVIAFDSIRLPDFSISFRIKPYLVSEPERRRCNLYSSPALVVSDLVSPSAQTLELVPTSGEITWYFGGRKLVAGSGWARWNSTNPDNASAAPLSEEALVIQLCTGTNRLIGVHSGRSHFEEIHLAGFVSGSITAKNPFGAGGFQVIPVADATLLPPPTATELPGEIESLIAAGPYPAMDPADTMSDANPQDRVVNARVLSLASDAARPPAVTSGLLRLPAGDGATAIRLVLDLGEVQNGWLAFTVYGSRESTLTFSFFESLQPGAPLRIVWPGACNNALRYQLREGWQTFESMLAYGVRYIAIHHEGDRPVELRDLRILSAHCGNLSAAVIRTGDVALDAIHALCEQTLLAATDDTLTDCPTYEAVNWNFDNRLGAIADLVTFRNLPLLRNTIEQYTRDPLYPGLVRSHTPSAWDNRIPVFSFHWILFCRDYYEHTADLAFVGRVFPQIARGLDEAIGMLDPATGLLRWRDAYDSWHIVDWAKGRDDKHDIVAAEQALLIGALEAGEYLATRLQHPESIGFGKFSVAVDHWRAAVKSLRCAIDRHLWQPALDAYADSLHSDGVPSPVSSQVSNAALALYRVGSPAWRSRLHRRLQTNDPALLPFGSPMGLFYILEFLDQREDVEAIFNLIRDKWTPMLLSGDKTAWEHFPEFSAQPDLPTRSRCHPFATYILKYYTKYLFGLTSTAPGRNDFHFNPRPPADLECFEGALPVTKGWIRVSWHRQEGGLLETSIEVPPGVVLHTSKTHCLTTSSVSI